MLRRVEFESPMTPSSRVELADGRVVPVEELLRFSPGALESLALSDDVRNQVERIDAGELVLPGADRWRSLYEEARPSAPVWVPAHDRNARVVEIQMARDALADPWQPYRSARIAGDDVSVVGAVAWQKGDAEFDVLVAPPGADASAVRVRLTDADRRKLWDHLTGFLWALRIEDGDLATGEGRFGNEWRSARASIGMTGSGLRSAYVGSDPDGSIYVREDGRFRADQQARTAVAEQYAGLLRRWRAASGPPVVRDLMPLSFYEEVGGRDDLAESVRGSGSAFWAAAAGVVALTGVWLVSRTDTVRDWLGLPSKVAA